MRMRLACPWTNGPATQACIHGLQMTAKTCVGDAPEAQVRVKNFAFFLAIISSIFATLFSSSQLRGQEWGGHVPATVQMGLQQVSMVPGRLPEAVSTVLNSWINLIDVKYKCAHFLPNFPPTPAADCPLLAWNWNRQPDRDFINKTNERKRRKSEKWVVFREGNGLNWVFTDKW